ncbi:MAG TPA: hypothetical protein DCY46_09230, partial [Lactobacillus sp.]|nr:hypothetical protein [Lactobacillus sp.]
ASIIQEVRRTGYRLKNSCNLLGNASAPGTLNRTKALIEVGHQVPAMVQDPYDQVIHLDTAGKSGVSKVIKPILANT